MKRARTYPAGSVREALHETKGMNVFLLPGELACRWLKVSDKESKMLLRLFVNLTVYGKAAIFVLMMALGIG